MSEDLFPFPSSFPIPSLLRSAPPFPPLSLSRSPSFPLRLRPCLSIPLPFSLPFLYLFLPITARGARPPNAIWCILRVKSECKSLCLCQVKSSRVSSSRRHSGHFSHKSGRISSSRLPRLIGNIGLLLRIKLTVRVPARDPF